jgi:DNA-directed RNA polymerase specialized sigma24 family protein
MASVRRRILWDTDASRVSERADPSAERALEDVLDGDVDCGEVLRRVMAEMTDAERQLYREAYLDRVPPEDLSGEYGISEAAIRMRISRLRKRIVTGLKKVLYTTLLSILTHIL